VCENSKKKTSNTNKRKGECRRGGTDIVKGRRKEVVFSAEGREGRELNAGKSSDEKKVNTRLKGRLSRTGKGRQYIEEGKKTLEKKKSNY